MTSDAERIWQEAVMGFRSTSLAPFDKTIRVSGNQTASRNIYLPNVKRKSLSANGCVRWIG